MSLSDAELDRYARHIVLPQVGGVGQQRFKASSVALVGAGAIGSAALAAFAGAGIGRLTIIDDDVIESSNLHRQLIFREDEIGRPKAETAARFARALNSHVEADAVPKRVTRANAAAILAGHDLVLDGSDNFATRLTVNEACVELRAPLVSAAAAQFQGQVALFRGWERDRPCYRCFVGDAFDADDCDSCAELGVLGALTATIGNFAALLSLGALLGAGTDPAGRLFLLEGLSLNWRSMTLPKDSSCETCGSKHEASP